MATHQETPRDLLAEYGPLSRAEIQQLADEVDHVTARIQIDTDFVAGLAISMRAANARAGA